MVGIFTALRQVNTRRQPGKGLKVVDEMCLVVIPKRECEIRPLDVLSPFNLPQRLLKAKHAAIHLRRETGSLPK